MRISLRAPDSFTIKYRSGNEYSTLKVPSISRSMIDQYEKEQSSNTTPEVPYSLEILPGNTALLTISSFWMGGDGTFKRFLKSSFSEMRTKGY